MVFPKNKEPKKAKSTSVFCKIKKEKLPCVWFILLFENLMSIYLDYQAPYPYMVNPSK